MLVLLAEALESMVLAWWMAVLFQSSVEIWRFLEGRLKHLLG